MAAPVVEPEDIVCVLLGSRFSVVLRPVKDENAFTFVCLCYLHGFMHGQDVKRWIETSASEASQERIMIGTIDGLIEIRECPPAARLEYVNLI